MCAGKLPANVPGVQSETWAESQTFALLSKTRKEKERQKEGREKRQAREKRREKGQAEY
jgi:hypothetical protein